MSDATRCLVQFQSLFETAKNESKALKDRVIKQEREINAAENELDERKEYIIKLENLLDRYKSKTTNSINRMQWEIQQYEEDKLNAKSAIGQMQGDIDELLQYKENSIKYRVARIHELSDEELKRLKKDINSELESVQNEKCVRAFQLNYIYTK